MMETAEEQDIPQSPQPKMENINFLEEARKIQQKHQKQKAKNPSKLKKKPEPSKPSKAPTAPPRRTQPSISEETIESFEMPHTASGNQLSLKNLGRILLLTICFYILGNTRTLAFTKSLEVSDRVDSLIIHAIMMGLISYLVFSI
jgi:hypothetical protein